MNPVPAISFRPWRGLLGLNGWTIFVVLIAALLVSPILAVVGIALSPSGDIWAHLVATVLPTYVLTTLGLALGVGVGVLVIGTGTAWLVTMCRFPGRRVFEWALLAPLAVPTYLAAFVYTDLLEFAGPVQGALRAVFGWSSRREYWFPEIRSLSGAIVFFTLVLYPYVYLLSRAAFHQQSARVFEAGRSLGRGPWNCFFLLALPLARPSIAVGLLLAMMETLNEFGAVDYFAVQTFTVGIYRVWFGMNNAPAAAQLASLVLVFVILLIWLERTARKRQRYDPGAGNYQQPSGYPLRRMRAALATTACFSPILLGFCIPAGVLLSFALDTYQQTLNAGFIEIIGNTLLLSALAALICVAVGLMLAYGVRLRATVLVRGAARVASVGYAVPGTVLAIGVLIPAARFDNALDAFLRANFGISTGLLLSGTIAVVTFAYVARFMALSYGSMEAGFAKVTPTMDEAARSLGLVPGAVLRRVHIPLLRGSLLTAMVLVFVDSMKELPMTLILRPFNFDTLATHVYEYASFEQFRESALAALTIVGAGLLPVILLSRGIARSRPGRRGEQPVDRHAELPAQGYDD